MGLLDDAIREHLDLKRRRGADPADIERAEREALGPVRRRFEEQDDVPEAGAAGEEDLVGEDVHEDWHEPQPDAPAAGAGGLEELDDLDAPGPASRWEDEDRLPPAEPHPPARASEAPVHGLDAETSEYDVASEHEHGTEGEDVLEETPEFLQDTPDHDRLWFEQRPPRDFDFDG
jgi:hypothetical protein